MTFEGIDYNDFDEDMRELIENILDKKAECLVNKFWKETKAIGQSQRRIEKIMNELISKCNCPKCMRIKNKKGEDSC